MHVGVSSTSRERVLLLQRLHNKYIKRAYVWSELYITVIIKSGMERGKKRGQLNQRFRHCITRKHNTLGGKR